MRQFLLGLLATPFVLAFVGASVQAQSLHGTVREAAGAPVANAPVTLTCGATATANTVTAINGGYRFESLAPCTYQLAVQSGSGSSNATVVVDAGHIEQTQDIVVITASSAAMAKPKFAASGIRGLIDPGGYSAPANAAAASGLLAGMADANRAKNAACASGRSLADLEAEHRASPDNVATTLNEAEALLVAQRFRAVLELLTSADAQRGGIRLLQLRARASEGLGNFREAAETYARAYALRPSPEDLFAEGYEEILDGKPTAATALYRQGLQTFPNAVSLHIGLGTTGFLAGHAPEAIRLFLSAAEDDPTDPRPYPFLAAASGVSDAENDRVMAALERHLALRPQDATAHLSLAMALQHKVATPERLSRIEAELRRALGSDPGLAEAHLALGTLEAQRGEHADAVRELRLAAALDPERRETHYRLAQELRKAGDADAAAREMQVFQKARAQEDSAGSDVTRYLSVMGKAAACPAP